MNTEDGDAAKLDNVESGEDEDEEMTAAFESWKSKTYALTVPLRVVALRNSMPPLWIKVLSLACFLQFSFMLCLVVAKWLVYWG